MNADPKTPPVRPFLTTLATVRTGSDVEVGRYCEVRDLWVVDGDDGPHPLVLLSDQAGQTSTSTKINVEADDTDVGAGFDLVTSTFVKAEADDVDTILAGADLATTTRVRAEADDTDRVAAALLGVTTKTDANVERDDTAVGLEMYEPAFGVRIEPLPVH